MAADLSHMRQSELVRLLNSTPLGEVTSERQVYRDRERAGLRIGEKNRVNLFKYAAWLAWERHHPKAAEPPQTYEEHKDRTARRGQSSRRRDGTLASSPLWRTRSGG